MINFNKLGGFVPKAYIKNSTYKTTENLEKLTFPKYTQTVTQLIYYLKYMKTLQNYHTFYDLLV